LPIFTQWNFGFVICPIGKPQICAIYNGTDSDITNYREGMDNFATPITKTVYTKSTVISVPDIIAKPFIVSENRLPNTGCCLPNNECDLSSIKAKCIPTGGKNIIIYLWEK